jgi:hypothetical protein
MLETVLATIAANAVLLGVLGFLFKALIGHFLDKDVSKFEQSLENRAVHEIESYKAQLDKERLRLQISYGGIFEKQANAILELYKGVVALERASFDTIHHGGSAAERQEAFRQSWAIVRNFHGEHRILLPQEIDDALAKFINDMFRNVFAYTRIEERNLGRVSDEEFQRLMDKQEKAYEVIDRDLPALKELLITSMRQAIGVVHN